jgi:NADPH:quinone reductase-like Zn-dependent oxidoreductase
VKAYSISSFGIDNFSLVDRPTPSPAANQVLIRVRAVSLNYRDLMVVKGAYNPKMKLPRIPFSDGAGEVVAVGDAVTRFRVGDRVAGSFFQNWIEGPPTAHKIKGALGGDIDGMLAEYVALNESGVVAVPAHLTFEEASTLPCAAVTAWHALVHAGRIQPGQTALIQGTGGVSIFALQFALLAGARVLGTSSNDDKLARAQKLGLAAGINYRQHPDWEKWAREQTAGEGVDVVIEVGGAGTFARSMQAVRVAGLIAQIGVLSATAEALTVQPILHKSLHVQGIYVGSRAMSEEMNTAIAQHQLHPVIDLAFEFAQAREALRYMESAGHFGKIVIRVGE